jgi:regulation of enolase protein 1 (concanavalin A-like superfamily)
LPVIKFIQQFKKVTMRDFWRFHFLKVLLILVIIQLGFFAWLQVRNHRPIAQNDEANIIEGQTVKIQPLRNDTDKDENELVLQSVSTPQHGTFTRDKNTLFYSAKMGYAGIDSFTYVVNDGKKDSKKAYIKVKIAENLKPVANHDFAQGYKGNKILLNVLGNDVDREGDSTFINDYSSPVSGLLQRTGNELIYTPSGSANTDSFQYTVSDGFKVSDKATVHIKLMDKTEPGYPWLSSDIGNTAIKGSTTCSNNKFIIKASGSDIWESSDSFHFTWQFINGDCEIYARVESIENTNPWAKAGIMVRETLAGNSKNAFIGLTSQNGITLQRRANTAGNSDGLANSGGKAAPYWIKLVRKGDNFSGYSSPDGKNWTETGSTTVTMTKNIYVGLCATSHDNSKIGQSVFSNYVLKGQAAKIE